MRKPYVDINGRFLGKHGIKPRNAVAVIPDSIDEADYRFLNVTPSGDTYLITVDAAFKAQTLDAEQKKIDIEALYNQYIKDVFDQMELTFGTRRSDTANANRETWKDMVINANEYFDQGIKSPEVLRDAEGNIMFGLGDALNTEQKILDYANRKLDQARTYGIWRFKRLDTFRDDKNAVLGV